MATLKATIHSSSASGSLKASLHGGGSVSGSFLNRGGLDHSVYDAAVQNGYTGTETEFVSLITHLEYQPFESRFHFPNIGDAGVLYGDTKENKLYRYDAEQHKYYCVGSDYNDITAIDGGHA